MNTITVVTGNPNKLMELQTIFPPNIGLQYAKLDIKEIQGERADPYEIVNDKLENAYALVGGPVIVEDISAELDWQAGMPGPFIKFYERRMGQAALWELAKPVDNRRATIRCVMGHYDGHTKQLVEGAVSGHVVPPRTIDGFGFDIVFVPDGHDRTVAEMTTQEKNAIGWRGRAVRALAAQLFPE